MISVKEFNDYSSFLTYELLEVNSLVLNGKTKSKELEVSTKKINDFITVEKHSKVVSEIFYNITNESLKIQTRNNYLDFKINPFIDKMGTLIWGIEKENIPIVLKCRNYLINLYENVTTAIEIAGLKNETPELRSKTSRYFNNNQRYYLLEKLNMLNPITNKMNISQESRNTLVAHILGIDVRVAKGLMNGDKKYCVKENGKQKVDEFLLGLK